MDPVKQESQEDAGVDDDESQLMTDVFSET